jgi:ATP-dependent RNA helicase DDX49/DBP8
VQTAEKQSEKSIAPMTSRSELETETVCIENIDNFHELKLAKWIVNSCATMGMKKPTPIQKACIPAVLNGRDVIGSALTGSGKTAAFALPILHRLSENPYGIFALVLTPTRELAFQIAEQFQALGAPLPVRDCVVVGGLDLMKQSIELDRLPHVVIATPGRLAGLLNGPRPPKLSKLKFLVLDEADRLFEKRFSKDLSFIFSKLPTTRQTLLFSATMSYNVRQSKDLAVSEPFVWTNEGGETTVTKLVEEYLFMPMNVKPTYLYKVLDKVGPRKRPSSSAGPSAQADDEEVIKSKSGNVLTRYRSAIVFMSTCSQCQLISQMLTELGITCVALHSQMSQRRRLAALGKFKSGIVDLLLATDVAGRGLDIPQVELVINFDIPRNAADYIHRVGRTARAGKGGHALALVSQFDVELLQNIEKMTGKKMTEYSGVVEDEVLPVLNRVTKAMRSAKIFLAENGLDEKGLKAKRKKKRPRNQ